MRDSEAEAQNFWAQRTECGRSGLVFRHEA
jgi:hypothetical protein